MKALPKQLNGLTLIETCITVTKNVTAHAISNIIRQWRQYMIQM